MNIGKVLLSERFAVSDKAEDSKEHQLNEHQDVLRLDGGGIQEPKTPPLPATNIDLSPSPPSTKPQQNGVKPPNGFLKSNQINNNFTPTKALLDSERQTNGTSSTGSVTPNNNGTIPAQSPFAINSIEDLSNQNWSDIVEAEESQY